MRTFNRGQRRVSPRVEELEGRQLLSVALLPGHINLKTVNHSHAAMTVAILSDSNMATSNLLKAPQDSLSVSVVDSGGTSTSLGQPLSVRSTDVNGDGVADLLLRFSRSTLKNLAAGTYQIQVSDGTAGDTEMSSFTLFNPGQGHGKGHHAGGSGQGSGLQTAASHNSDSQAGEHSAVFGAMTSPGSQATTPTLPDAAADGIANAAEHNGSSQAGAHSPVFHHG
jgi:hypothetical protein